MVLYQELGFKSETEYLDKLFSTFLPSNKTYAYFVDWKTVKENVLKYTTEIGILNSLANVPKPERKAKLLEIIRRYPEVVPLIPALIAVRENSVEIYDVLTNETRLFSFSKTAEHADDLVEFCEKSGLIAAFDEINDLHTYLLGVEVGTGTNARKNRSGDIFQEIVDLKLKKCLAGLDVTIRPQFRIESGRNKTVDFAIMKGDKPVAVIECNFYGGSGSKPIETASAYVDLQRKMRAKGLPFIWVTDGKAWDTMHETLKSTTKEIDYVLNLNLLESNVRQIIEKFAR